MVVGPGLIEAKLANLPPLRRPDQAERVPSAGEAHYLLAVLRLAGPGHRTGDTDRVVAIDLDNMIAAVMLRSGIGRAHSLQNLHHTIARKALDRGHAALHPGGLDLDGVGEKAAAAFPILHVKGPVVPEDGFAY